MDSQDYNALSKPTLSSPHALLLALACPLISSKPSLTVYLIAHYCISINGLILIQPTQGVDY
jgi:hypothetical protein